MNTGRSTSNPQPPLTPFHPSALFPFLSPPPLSPFPIPYPTLRGRGAAGMEPRPKALVKRISAKMHNWREETLLKT